MIIYLLDKKVMLFNSSRRAIKMRYYIIPFCNGRYYGLCYDEARELQHKLVEDLNNMGISCSVPDMFTSWLDE